VSPFKVLDRIFHPDYMIVVKYPDNRQVVITMISMYSPKLPVEQIKPFVRSDDVTIRRHYKSIIKKPDFVMEPRILVGTVEGKRPRVIALEIKRIPLLALASRLRDYPRESINSSVRMSVNRVGIESK